VAQLRARSTCTLFLIPTMVRQLVYRRRGYVLFSPFATLHAAPTWFGTYRYGSTQERFMSIDHACVRGGLGGGRGGGGDCQRVQGPFANCTLFVSSTCSSFVAPLNLHQTVSRREPHIGSAANLPLQGRRGGVCALPILWFPRQSLGVLTVLTFVPNVSRKARAAPRCPELASRTPTHLDTHAPAKAL
jgi:hypothetical protein